MVTRPLPLDERDETLSLPVIAERAPSMREVTLCSIKRAEASGHVKETSIFRSTGEGGILHVEHRQHRHADHGQRRHDEQHREGRDAALRTVYVETVRHRRGL